MLRFDVPAAAVGEPPGEALLSAAVDLGTLGVEPAQIEQRQIGFWMQERLADGQTVSVPAQAELLLGPQGRIKLTWLAPRVPYYVGWFVDPEEKCCWGRAR